MTGMNAWHVVAAYSLWEHTTDPRVARYRDIGAQPLWALVNRGQTTTGNIQTEQWVLSKQKETQYLSFENGTLTALKK